MRYDRRLIDLESFDLLPDRSTEVALDFAFVSQTVFRSLLRKEVIQPQVPLRLPCYDFVQITTHTFGAF